MNDLTLEITLENRGDYYAARTNPYKLTAYGDSPESAISRALKAFTMKYDRTNGVI